MAVFDVQLSGFLSPSGAGRPRRFAEEELGKLYLLMKITRCDQELRVGTKRPLV